MWRMKAIVWCEDRENISQREDAIIKALKAKNYEIIDLFDVQIGDPVSGSFYSWFEESAPIPEQDCIPKSVVIDLPRDGSTVAWEESGDFYRITDQSGKTRESAQKPT